MNKILVKVSLFITLVAVLGANIADAGQGCPFDNGSCQEYCATQGCHMGYCGHFAWIQCICRKCGEEWTRYEKARNRDTGVNSTAQPIEAQPTSQLPQDSEISDESAEKGLLDFLQNSAREGRMSAEGKEIPKTIIKITPSSKDATGFVIANANDPEKDTVIVKTPVSKDKQSTGDSNEQQPSSQLYIVNDIITRLKPLIANNGGNQERTNYRLPLTATQTDATTAESEPQPTSASSGSVERPTDDEDDDDNRLWTDMMGGVTASDRRRMTRSTSVEVLTRQY